MQSLINGYWSPAFVLAAGLSFAQACAQNPTTRPAENGPANVNQDIRLGPPDPSKPPPQISKWFEELSSSDGKVRDAAKMNLMGLGRDYLPTLRQIVEQRRPLLPSQAVVLKEIVSQIYLSGDKFDIAVNGRYGFLGIRPAIISVGTRPADDQQQPAQQVAQQPAQQAFPNAPFPGELEMIDPNQICGILVMECMPGFAGARGLQNGDVILGIIECPNVRFRVSAEFSDAVRNLGAGEKVHFEVLRQGQIIRVEIILGPRPDEAEIVPAGVSPMQKLLERRLKEVDDLWEAQFAPLLQEGVG